MPRYLVKVSYTAAGAAGLLKEGGSSRRALVQNIIGQLGGSVETFDFAFGEYDAYVTVELPTNVDAAAVALAVGASGAASTNVSVLLTPEEVDEVAKRQVGYRAPGA